MFRIKGLIPAVFTPMKEDGSVNIDMIKPIAEYLLSKGITGIYVCGTTGEGASLSSDERRDVARAYVEAISGRISVIIQVGHNSLAEAKRLAHHAKSIGADAIAAVPPAYFKPRSVDNLVDCMSVITEGIKDMPFFYYHVPSLNGVNLDMAQFLSKGGEKITGLAGIKYSHTALHEFQACSEYEDGRYTILFGSDEMMLSALAVGAKGAVGSTFNFAAPLYNRILSAYRDGNMDQARKYQSLSVSMVRIFCKYESTVQPALKGVMKLIGLDCGPNRLPLETMRPDKLVEMAEELRRLGFFEWAG